MCLPYHSFSRERRWRPHSGSRSAARPYFRLTRRERGAAFRLEGAPQVFGEKPRRSSSRSPAPAFRSSLTKCLPSSDLDAPIGSTEQSRTPPESRAGHPDRRSRRPTTIAHAGSVGLKEAVHITYFLFMHHDHREHFSIYQVREDVAAPSSRYAHSNRLQIKASSQMPRVRRIEAHRALKSTTRRAYPLARGIPR